MIDVYLSGKNYSLHFGDVEGFKQWYSGQHEEISYVEVEEDPALRDALSAWCNQ